jgi:hypothetical protein
MGVFLAALVMLLINGEARSQQVQFIGAGANSSCGSWLADRASNNFFSKVNWALGFLSGAATYSEDLNPLNGVDADAVAYWLDNYCRARPEDRFVEAVRAFARAHPR